MEKLLALPYNPNVKGPGTYFKEQEILAKQVSDLGIGDGVGITDGSKMAFATEAFLTSGHIATNIASINAQWEAKNTAEKARNPGTWENTQMSRFQTFYSNKLCRLYVHCDRGQAQEKAMSAQL